LRLSELGDNDAPILYSIGSHLLVQHEKAYAAFGRLAQERRTGKR